MKWLYRHLHKKEKGFTLVELMVVIIILAVLTGIAIPSYLALRNRARAQATRSEMKNISTALEMYAADEEQYPVTADYPGDIDPAYMRDVPLLDAWGSAYGYISADGSTYTLTAPCGTQPDITITDGQFD